ncbi:MAG TPA: hypothetical protein VGT61_12045 [Thermomicrobiales bacterium]|jgi:hypothetical protein|nr:hypothetical protein [Thermomicrobiales bacterium]
MRESEHRPERHLDVRGEYVPSDASPVDQLQMTRDIALIMALVEQAEQHLAEGASPPDADLAKTMRAVVAAARRIHDRL